MLYICILIFIFSDVQKYIKMGEGGSTGQCAGQSGHRDLVHKEILTFMLSLSLTFRFFSISLYGRVFL